MPFVCGDFCIMYQPLNIEEINARLKDSFLTALCFDGYYIKPGGSKNRKIKCQCRCGNTKSFPLSNLLSGNTKSCGCYNILNIKRTKTKYYPAIRSLYNIYCAMIRRCNNPLHPDYHNYGGRGVKVCKQWEEDYQNFLNWSLSNGWQKGLQLDKDIKGEGLLYSPDSCIWVTSFENANNKRNTKKYFFNSQYLSISEIAKILKLPRSTITERLNRGWSIEAAFSNDPSLKGKHYKKHINVRD